jgi:uncharacterized OsmC-like protein
MTSDTVNLVNGVPVDSCLSLVNHVRVQPEVGQTVWKSVTQWNGGFRCRSTIREHSVQMDEPIQLGGTDTAPNMVEAVLAAYGSCLMVGYALNASLRGIQVRDLEIEVEGDLDLAGFFGLSDEVPAGFTDIHATVRLDAEADADTLKALHDHVLKTSPVGSILTRPLHVTTDLITV